MRLNSQVGLEEFLNKCVTKCDVSARPYAVRALAALADHELSGPKYDNGVLLLYPDTAAQVHSALQATGKLVTDSRQESEFDIVFVHGVEGDALHTWQCGPRADKPKYAIIYPF